MQLLRPKPVSLHCLLYAVYCLLFQPPPTITNNDLSVLDKRSPQVAKITIVVGLILIGLGLYGYFGTGTTSITALIPAFVGTPILLLGALALKDSMRKHAMHAAVMLGLLGFLGAVGNVARVLAKGGEIIPTAMTMTCSMGVVCAVFVALCVRSFIQARKARKATLGA
jgi:peptidoglycan/LPS O-acetylase OafA/YrhL